MARIRAPAGRHPREVALARYVRRRSRRTRSVARPRRSVRTLRPARRTVAPARQRVLDARLTRKRARCPARTRRGLRTRRMRGLRGAARDGDSAPRAAAASHGVVERTVSDVPSAKPNVPVVVHSPLAGQSGGAVISVWPPPVRTGILKASDFTAVSPSGGPPGVLAGGWAVTVVPLIVRRSKAGDTGVPGAVMTSMSWLSPLNTWLSPVSGSAGGPKPVIALNEPTVSWVAAGQASGPRVWSSWSVAVHFATAPLSKPSPSGTWMTAVRSGDGLLSRSPDLLKRTLTSRPVGAPGDRLDRCTPNSTR